MPASLLLATRSRDKAREIGQILASSGLELLTLADVGVEPDPEEDHIEVFSTFQENALAKARYFLRRTGLATLSDDSGLVVDALGGAPGVRSKRFAQDHPSTRGSSDAQELGTDQLNNRCLLRALDGVPDASRTARYLCAAAVAVPDGGPLVALGACEGRILSAPRGTGGFGYDPLFAPVGSTRSFAEWAAAEKNRVSHRARAFRALATLATWLSERVDSTPLRR